MTRFSHLPKGYEDQDTQDRKKADGEFTFTIPGELPTQNEMISASNYNRHHYNEKKKDTEEVIKFYAEQAGVPFFEKTQLEITYYRSDRRYDPDNIIYSKKLILDCLEKMGVIPGDGWEQIKPPFIEYWELDKENPRTVVTLKEA